MTKLSIITKLGCLLTIKFWPYSPLHNRDEILTKIAPNVTNAMDDAHHLFEENKESRRWKHLLLEFPVGHEMSAKDIFDDAGDDEEFELELVPFVYTHSGVRKAINTIHYAAWKVARKDLRASKRGKVEHRENKSKAASLLAGIMNS